MSMNISSIKNNTNNFIKNTATLCCPVEYKNILCDEKNNLPRVNSINALSFFGLYNKSKNNLRFHPIANAKPIYKPCCSYEDLDVFSKEFVKKLETQLLNPTIDDINKMVLRLSNRTQASDDLIMEVLFRLTQFSSYDSLFDIEKVMHKKGLDFVSYTGFLSINAVFNYLENRKFNFCSTPNSKETFFLDNMLLEMLEASKSKKFLYEDELSYFNAKISKSLSKICVLDGFDVKAGNGKYYSCGFASGSGYLESLAYDVIKRVQAGENLDEILNGDLIKRFKTCVPDYSGEFLIIKKNRPEKITSQLILENLRTKNINECNLKKYLNIKPGYTDSESEFKTYQKALMKYLDNFCMVFSPATFELEMMKLGNKIRKINNQSNKDFLFYVPDEYKSYGLMTYMFAKCNQVPFDKIRISNKVYDDDCQLFVVDDASISGKSIESAYDALNMLFSINGSNQTEVYFSPLVSVYPKDSFDESINLIDNIKVGSLNEFIDGNSFVSYVQSGEKNEPFDYMEREVLNDNFDRGFLGCTSAIIFPYIIPDNSPLIIAKIFDSFLHKSTITSNKGLSSAIGIINNKNCPDISQKKFLLIKKALLDT